jgi:hypothetical protein
MLEPQKSSDTFTQHFLPVAGVAFAGIVQVSSQDGPFSLWNVMIGVPLLSLLAVYEPRDEMSQREILAWSVTCAFTVMSTLGVVFQAAYRLVTGMVGVIPPFVEGSDWEAPQEYYFVIWLVLCALSYAYLRARRLRPKVAESAAA